MYISGVHDRVAEVVSGRYLFLSVKEEININIDCPDFTD